MQLVLNMLMSRRLAGPGCDERVLETAATYLQSPSQRQLSMMRLRGTRVLGCGTAAEQVLHSLFRDDNVEEVELLELREKKGGAALIWGR